MTRIDALMQSVAGLADAYPAWGHYTLSAIMFIWVVVLLVICEPFDSWRHAVAPKRIRVAKVFCAVTLPFGIAGLIFGIAILHYSQVAVTYFSGSWALSPVVTPGLLVIASPFFLWKIVRRGL